MPTVAPSHNSPPPQAATSFIDGTYEYSEIIGSWTYQLGASSIDLPPIPITPGGFLRGVTITVSSTGASGGSYTADGQYMVFSNISLETVDGTPILYPMNGFSYALAETYCRPWQISPLIDPDQSSTTNPGFTFRLSNELRATLGTLPNTDARAQYRLRLSLNSLAGLYATAPSPAPTVTVQVAVETYAQPPATTLAGKPVAQLPDGLTIQRFLSHQLVTGLSNGDNTIQATRTGNLLRSHILVFRNSSGVRTDLATDPIRFRVDNTQLFVTTGARMKYNAKVFLDGFGAIGLPGIGTAAYQQVFTGVYFLPRYQNVGHMTGQSWLGTTPQTFVQYEVLGAQAAGTCEIITEDLAPKSSAIPPYLENI
ncbi:MAG: hypothetical protein JSR64_17070 [Nitrospira sp.]|nr:hypothetical protein [Nitrospira sp.]